MKYVITVAIWFTQTHDKGCDKCVFFVECVDFANVGHDWYFMLSLFKFLDKYNNTRLSVTHWVKLSLNF